MKSLSSKSELKSLVKECVKEVLFEEGIISDLVSEIAAGFVKANLLENRNTQPRQITQSVTERVMERKREPVIERQKYTENKNKVSETLKKMYGGVDLFEGTTPAPAQTTGNTQTPLSGVDPNDSGVDISNIPGMKVWRKLI